MLLWMQNAEMILAAGADVLVAGNSVFAAADPNFYHLIPQSVAFPMMVAVTVLSGWMSLRFDSKLLAVMGVLGGYGTPVMLAIQHDVHRVGGGDIERRGEQFRWRLVDLEIGDQVVRSTTACITTAHREPSRYCPMMGR